MKMYEKKYFPRTTWDLKKMNDDGKLSFDNAAQRSLTWNNDQKSLLIHTMIIDFAVPPMYCNCLYTDIKNKVYDFIDGKQRTLGAIIPFLNDEYKLTNVPVINLDENSESDEEADPDKLIDINGLTYSELSQDFKDKIRNYSITVYYYENMTQDDAEELFRRLNNGSGLTQIEKTRVLAKSFNKIRELGKHDIFTSALSEKAITKYTNEDIIIKAYAVLYSDSPSLETKYIRPLMETADITEQQENEINNILNRINETYNIISNSEDKQDLKVAKRMLTRTHLISIVPVTLYSINDEISIEQYVAFIKKLFSGVKSATNIEEYNENATSGSAKLEAVKTRLEAVSKFYKQNI